VIYEMMMDLMKAESHCTDKVREAEKEIIDSLDERMREESASELDVTIFDTKRNDKALKHRIELVNFLCILHWIYP